VITRRGIPVASVSAVDGPKAPIDFGQADALRAQQKPALRPSAQWLREMRDQARY